jgi:integrase
MSRRRGQEGHISKQGNWWTVRYWKDVPGQEQRINMREKICPTHGPGTLTASARRRRAREIIEASGADKPETLQASIASVCGTTFRQQAETWLNLRRKKGTAPSTMAGWECGIENRLNPAIGDLPLSSIKKTAAQQAIDKMVEGGLSASAVNTYFAVVKMVLSVTNEDGDSLYPRSWNKMQLVIPKIVSKKLRRPCFTSEVMAYLATSPSIKPKMRMLFILCGASGLRIGEALGIHVDKVLDGGSRIIIDSKAWNGEEHDFLKTENGEREIDLPENVARLLVEFIGNRTSGLLFQTRRGKQLSQSNILRRHLHPALEEVKFEKSGAHAFRRYRNTFLRSTSCPLTLINYWLGWSGDSMSEHYDRSVLVAKFRKDVADRVGVGFDVPAHLNLKEPKTEPTVEVEVAVNCSEGS